MRETHSLTTEAVSDPVGRRKSVLDALADALEGELYADVIDAYRAALRSDDRRLALMAANDLLDRVYGKPKRIVELVEPADDAWRLLGSDS